MTAAANSLSLADRDAIVDIARSWIGTPYRHQCALKGAGTDCLGLLRGVWSTLYGLPAERPPAYHPNWYMPEGQELLLDKAHQYLTMADYEAPEAQPGDVLVFRMKPRAAAKHCGIVSYDGRMVHALTNRRVEEVTIMGGYTRRAVGVFSFPKNPKGV